MPSCKKSRTLASTPLPANFVPGPFDVICARGKEAKNHIGNKLYCERIRATLDTYTKANTRGEKSKVVSEVIAAIRTASPDGGFVKQVDGVWCEVGDHLAREKVGQSLRDYLHEVYRSGAKNKRRRRIAVGAKIVVDVEQLIRSNQDVSNRIEKLCTDISTIQENEFHAPPEEVFVANMFTQANLEILEAFKRDATLLVRFNEAEMSQKIGLLQAF